MAELVHQLQGRLEAARAIWATHLATHAFPPSPECATCRMASVLGFEPDECGHPAPVELTTFADAPGTRWLCTSCQAQFYLDPPMDPGPVRFGTKDPGD